MSHVVAIGALGGSGTRAIAQVLIDAGIFMGDRLNSAKDNLIFTHLFKDAAYHADANADAINARLAVFEEYMQRNHLSWSQARMLLASSRENPNVRSKLRFRLHVLRKTLSPPVNRELWGWKEPNTQIYIQEISDYFPGLKYIHVLRHGLDMAFSANRKQLVNWGHLYGIHLSADATQQETAYQQLEYWVRSTRAVMEKIQALPNGFLLINHARFCSDPEAQIERMLAYLEMTCDLTTRKSLYQIPRTPSTEGRYRKRDLGIFDQAQLNFVHDMGFEI